MGIVWDPERFAGLLCGGNVRRLGNPAGAPRLIGIELAKRKGAKRKALSFFAPALWKKKSTIDKKLSPIDNIDSLKNLQVHQCLNVGTINPTHHFLIVGGFYSDVALPSISIEGW